MQNKNSSNLNIDRCLFATIPLHSVTRSRPVGLHDGDDYLFANEYVKVFDPVNIWFKKNVIMPYIGPYIHKRRIDKEQYTGALTRQQLLRQYVKLCLCAVRARHHCSIEKAIYVSNSNSVNFFHWFLDILPKIQWFASFCDQAGLDRNFAPFIFQNTDQSEFAKSSLHALNVVPLVVPSYSNIKVDKLLHIPNIAPTGNYRGDILIPLRNRLVGYYSTHISPFSGSKRIYITRRNAKSRRITNETELFPLLDRYGFEILDFDKLSFDDQLSYAMSASHIMSVHGAALTHMLWMKKHSTVIELRAAGDRNNNCFFSLAYELGHLYRYLEVDRCHNTKSFQEDDVIVNPKLMQKLLNSL